MSALFVPDRTRDPASERRRLWTIANHVATEAQYDELCRLDSELFAVAVGETLDGPDLVDWREDA